MHSFFNNFKAFGILIFAVSLAGSVALGIAMPVRSAAVKEADAAKEAGLIPHRAIYDIRLAGTKSGSQIINISGQMFYEWQPSCDAWITNHRFNLLYEYADSPAMQIASDFSTFESMDGKTLNFTSQRKRDGQLFEELRGRAALGEGEEKEGEASYSLPEGMKFTLPAGSVFPMGHTLNVLKAIKEGRKFYSTVIFDGSDQDGPVEVNAFIGGPAQLGDLKKSASFDTDLLSSPAHKVRLAFFPLNKPDSESDYEMTLVLHENGIVSDMKIDYDDFSISQTLTALEPLAGDCGKSDGENKKK